MKSIENFNLDFLDSRKVYNIVSKVIVRSDILKDALENEETVHRFLHKFNRAAIKWRKISLGVNVKT